MARKVRKLAFYVGRLPENHPVEDLDSKRFCLMDLIKVVAQAMEKWIASYNADRSKFRVFVERYDKILSDSRFSITEFE